MIATRMFPFGPPFQKKFSERAPQVWSHTVVLMIMLADQKTAVTSMRQSVVIIKPEENEMCNVASTGTL